MSYSAIQPPPLATNGYKVELPERAEVIVRDFPDPSEVKAERVRLKDYWFVHWVGGKLYHLRLQNGGPNVDGEQKVLPVSECLWLLRARVDDVVGAAFHKYIPIKARPFTFLAQKAELIQNSVAAAGIQHPLIAGFKATPKFILNAKTYDALEGEANLGVFVTVGLRYDIDASLTDLQSAGLDLSGMILVRRIPTPGKRRLAGRLAAVAHGQVQLSDATDEASFPVDALKLEGSKENLARCLSAFLGSVRYKELMVALDDQEANYHRGPDFDKIVKQMGDFLRTTPLMLAQGLEARIGSRIVLENGDGAPSIRVAPAVDYVFDRTGTKSDIYAWRGLAEFGPYDRTVFANKSPRILVVYPVSTQGKVESFLQAFRDGMGSNYAGFPKGFVALFGLVDLTFIKCPVEVSTSDKLGAEAAYRTAIEARLAANEDVHGALIVLFEEHAAIKGEASPYIRTKALLLTLGIPSQEVRMPTVSQAPGSLQYTLQNLSIAVYAKLNGTPWTVNQDKAISDELVLGMGVAELSESRFEDRQRFVGITTVFSGDGTYLLGSVSKECDYAGYPDMLRESLLSVLKELKKRNNWQPGDTVRVIFHAHHPLKRIDVGNIVFACAREIGSEQDIQMAFVTVGLDHPFFLFDYKQHGVPVKRDSSIKKGIYAPVRGTIARMGRFTRLLAVNSGPLIKRANTPLPKPLLISLHPDSTFKDVDYIAEQALKFTSLSWRSTLPAGTPVTVFYSERIAELLGRLKDIPDFSPSALSVRLKWSRWFL